MKGGNFTIIVFAFLTLIILLSYVYTEKANIEVSSNVETFNILGALAPYRKKLATCLKECNRQNPDARLLQSGNFNCSLYCESVLTDMARRGVPPEHVKIDTSSKVCQNQCSSPHKIEEDKCISTCECHHNVLKWCDNQCLYSTLNKEDCMKQCSDVYLTNCNQVSWDWRNHG